MIMAQFFLFVGCQAGVAHAFGLAGQLSNHLSVFCRVWTKTLNPGLGAPELGGRNHIHGLGNLLRLAHAYNFHFYIF